jgi:hypothetical protein
MKLVNRVRRRIIRMRFARPTSQTPRKDGPPKQLWLLIGPESSGTRILDSALSLHPSVLGSPEAIGHLDVLDEVWQALEAKDVSRAVDAFPDASAVTHIITRRSMPHAHVFGQPAIYMDFPNLKGLLQVCRRLDFELVLLITTRSPIPNLLSWTQSRLSAGRDFNRAKNQYQASYRYLFDFINKHNVTFYFLSLEALLLDQGEYIQSLFQLLGLPEAEVELSLRPAVNQKHYELYDRSGDAFMESYIKRRREKEAQVAKG